jgi:hypothetical protein
MKKITDRQLKAWGRAYRKGRPMPLKAEIAELNYIIDNIDKFLEEWKAHQKKYMSFKNYLKIEIGMWEVKYGFYRRMKLKWNSLKKKITS